MKILIKRPNKKSEIIDINNSLEEKQKLVEGLIEYLHIPTFEDEYINIIVNEEGKLFDLDNNIALVNDEYIVDVLKGAVLFTGCIYDENEGYIDTDLTDKQIDFINSHLNSYIKAIISDETIDTIKITKGL